MSLQNATLPDNIASVLDSALATVNDVYNSIPGSAILWRYVKSSHQNDPYRTVLELLLFFFVIRTWRQSRTKSDAARKGYVKLTEKEIDELVSDWTPEPLVLPPSPYDAQLAPPPVISGAASLRPKIFIPNSVSSTEADLPVDLASATDASSDGTDTPVDARTGITATECINLASPNFAGLAGAERITEKAIECLKGYGVGSCGPPGFYGHFDVHMQLEDDISRFLGTEGTIIYAQSFSTISSVIPTFLKRGDIIVADRGCNFAIQKGIQISRTTVRWYDHNDVGSLERTLRAVEDEMKKYRRPLTRKFIITEGVFENDGMIVDLPAVLELAKKHKFRLMLDETWSIGSMGKTGRGLTEVFGIPASEIDMLIGSMATGFCSGGGFCSGSADVVRHQRINSAAVVFSAALPPMLACAASEAISILTTPAATPNSSTPKLPLSTLSTNVRILRSTLDELVPAYLTIPSHPASPLIHLQIRRRAPKTLAVPSPDKRRGARKVEETAVLGAEEEVVEQESLLQAVVDECLKEGVLVSRTKKVWSQEMLRPRPSIRLVVSAALEEEEVKKAADVLARAVRKVLGEA